MFSLSVLTRVFDIGCAIPFVVWSLLRQCMHGQAFVASRSVLGRRSLWSRSNFIKGREEIVAASSAAVAFWRSFISLVELWLFDSTCRTIRIDTSFSNSVGFSSITPQCWEAIAPTNAHNHFEESGRAWLDASKTTKCCHHTSERQASQR